MTIKQIDLNTMWNQLCSRKTHPDIRKIIRDCADEVSALFNGGEYLESQHRNMMARKLTRKLKDVHENFEIFMERPVPLFFPNEPIPFGMGYIDIVIFDKSINSSIILELKITTKDPKRQLNKYMTHWRYTPLLFGMTINFSNDKVCINDYEFRANIDNTTLP